MFHAFEKNKIWSNVSDNLIVGEQMDILFNIDMKIL